MIIHQQMTKKDNNTNNEVNTNDNINSNTSPNNNVNINMNNNNINNEQKTLTDDQFNEFTFVLIKNLEAKKNNTRNSQRKNYFTPKFKRRNTYR